MRRTTSKRGTRKRPENRKKENSEKKEEEDYTEQTVFKTIINIWTIRCHRLNFEFISVLSIYVYTCSFVSFTYKGECGMTSLYAVTYMYSINSSYDSFVPVKDAMLLLETMLIYSLTFELRLSIGIDYSASTLSLSLFKKIQQAL